MPKTSATSQHSSPTTTSPQRPENDKWLRDLLTRLQVEIAICPDHLEGVLTEVLDEIFKMSPAEEDYFFKSLGSHFPILARYDNYRVAYIKYLVRARPITVGS